MINVVTSDHRRRMLIPGVNGNCLARLLVISPPETDVNTSCKNSQIFEDKTSRGYIKPRFTPSYCQQIWFPCCLTAKWCSKHWVPRGLWEKWHICCACSGPLIVFLRYVFFFLWLNHLLTMPGIVALFVRSVFALSLEREREKSWSSAGGASSVFTSHTHKDRVFLSRHQSLDTHTLSFSFCFWQ